MPGWDVTHTCSCKACICFVISYVFCMFFSASHMFMYVFFNSISFLYVFFFWFYTFLYFSAIHIYFFWKSICFFCDSICVILWFHFFCWSICFIYNHMFSSSSYVILIANDDCAWLSRSCHHLHYFPAHTPPTKCHDCAWQWEKQSLHSSFSRWLE